MRPIRQWRDDPEPWLLTTLSLVLLSTAALSLPSAWTSANTAEWRQLYTGIGIVTAVLAVLVWVAYGVFGNWRTVGQAVPVVLLIFGGMWGVGQVVALSFDRGTGREAAALIQRPAPDVADLAKSVRDLSALHGGGQSDGKIDLIWPARPGDPMLAELRWLLRDHAASASPRRSRRMLPRSSSRLSRISRCSKIATAAPSSRYSSTWRPTGLGDFNAYLRWVLYREAKTAPEMQKVILWVDRTQK